MTDYSNFSIFFYITLWDVPYKDNLFVLYRTLWEHQPTEDELGGVRNAHKILVRVPAEDRLRGIDQSEV